MLNNRGYTASEAPPKTKNGTLQKYANENGLVVITRDGDWLEDWMTRNQRTGVIKLDGKSTIQKRGLANDAKYVLDNYGDELADGQLFEVIHAGPGQGPDVIRRERPGEPVPPGPRSPMLNR